MNEIEKGLTKRCTARPCRIYDFFLKYRLICIGQTVNNLLRLGDFSGKYLVIGGIEQTIGGSVLINVKTTRCISFPLIQERSGSPI